LLIAVFAMALPTVNASRAQAVASSGKSNIVSAGNPRNGKLVFESQGCDKCHGSQGEGVSATGSGVRVPPIDPKALVLPTFIQRIRKPKGKMPPFSSRQVSEQELADVYAFLHSLTHPVEQDLALAANPANGQRLFSKYGCYECHLSHGQGSRVTGVRVGPPAIPFSAFMSYVRKPTGDMPPYTRKTISNEELADMYEFLKSVPQPPSWTTIPLLNQ
jgi:mono/diheme cytochrome c family protein